MVCFDANVWLWCKYSKKLSRKYKCVLVSLNTISILNSYSPVWKIEFLSGEYFSRRNGLACQELVHPLTKAKLFASLACHIIYFTNLPTEFTTWHRMLCSIYRLWCLTKEGVRAISCHMYLKVQVVIAGARPHIP